MTCFKLIHFNYVIRNLFTTGVIKNSNITPIKSKKYFFNTNNILGEIFNFPNSSRQLIASGLWSAYLAKIKQTIHAITYIILKFRQML